VKNIIFLLDVCHSGGAGAIQQHLDLTSSPDTNLFIIGAARHDQAATESSSLQHGLFTSCLLQAFEQKPRKDDGWLTISDIHSFVSEAITSEGSKLSVQESPVQIQARVASVNPNLPFIKNPHYSPESCVFHKEVEKLLGLVGYEPMETVVPKGAPAGFYVAKVKCGLRTHRVGIIPYYNSVVPLTSEGAEGLALFIKKQVEQKNLNEGLLVTASEVSNEVRNTVHAAYYLDVRTHKDIWEHLIDFDKYLKGLVDDYQTVAPERRDNPPLAQVYIPLRAEHRQYAGSWSLANLADVVAIKSSSELGRGYQVGWQGDLEEEVKRWLSDPTPRKALVADYGSGKTSFCQHLAAQLADDCLNAKKNGRYGYRIPLVIRLRDFSKNPADLERHLADYLKQYYEVDIADSKALMKMAEAGLLLFLFDGLDEMASRATTDTIRQNIALLERYASLPQNKVLLTTRPEYFLSVYEERQALQAYPCLYLQPFTDRQVDLYLQRRVPLLKSVEGEPSKYWTYYRQQINRIHDLSDLAYRPVLLEIIIKTLPTLVAKDEVVNRPNLYRYYLERELDRQSIDQHRDLSINRQKRFEIMEQMALEMYQTNSLELTNNQIRVLLTKLLTQKQPEEIDGLLREIVTCSFLIRVGEAAYGFSHQSFQEYLVARCLAQDITHDNPKNLKLKLLTSTIRDFLLELEEGVVQRGSITANIGDVIVSFDHERLESWFQANPKDRWMSSNAASLLVRLLPHDRFCQLPLQQADLAGVDLAGADLHSANLAGADLHSANLAGADLIGVSVVKANLAKVCLAGAHLNADLRNAHLVGADLTGMDLHGASLAGANLAGADLHGTNLARADLHGASLAGANLAKADLHDTNLARANLAGADLHGANLREANLAGVDLYDTNLEGANLFLVNLVKVNLPRARLAGADLHSANLEGADLGAALLEGADLRGANLAEADLRGAVLSGANLSGANLAGTIYERKVLYRPWETP
jgi:uncharacterized protein YjbI with pentapeptide repeats